MAKQIVFGEEARKALQSGIDQLANTGQVLKLTATFFTDIQDFPFIFS